MISTDTEAEVETDVEGEAEGEEEIKILSKRAGASAPRSLIKGRLAPPPPPPVRK